MCSFLLLGDWVIEPQKLYLSVRNNCICVFGWRTWKRATEKTPRLTGRRKLGGVNQGWLISLTFKPLKLSKHKQHWIEEQLFNGKHFWIASDWRENLRIQRFKLWKKGNNWGMLFLFLFSLIFPFPLLLFIIICC